MWSRALEVVREALADFSGSWRSLALTDLAYKAVAFAVLTPATTLFLRWLLSRSGSRVVADADILRFLVGSPEGIAALVLGGALMIAIAAIEAGCLMAIGLASARGVRLDMRGALRFGAARGGSILLVTVHMVLRIIGGLLPFLLALGLVYIALLRGHDINYFLAIKPAEFWLAAALGGAIIAALAALLVRTVVRWSLALPLVLFEHVHPRHALEQSAARSAGIRSVIAAVLAGWAATALALAVAASWILDFVARAAAPYLASSLAVLLFFLAGLVILWAAVGLVVGVINFSLFALLIVRLWLHAGAQAPLHIPATAPLGEGIQPRLSRGAAVATVATAVLFGVGVALLAFMVTRGNDPVLVIAHRGSSLTAPENTLAAFRQAIAEKADYVELDVQESLDGEVLVIHDSDLMKVGGSPMKIWEHSAAELRAVDIGSHSGPQFRNERVPTLAEALAVCKGGARVLIELKSYGHNQRLEQRVAEIVEGAGMQNACTFMSLDHEMVRTMKRLRPSWSVGALAAKTMGDPTTLGADFLAVEARIANARFIRRAHRAGQDVYVWTVDDPAWMLSAMSYGADGIITNKPAVARYVVGRRAGLSDAQRLLVALLVRSGATTERLQSEDSLRP